ncbi:MAG: hypothetical protein GF381_02830 [Candidatus Pacebacteria bacterium]|nr:hypothetical protein [Candidatus Paceibacterota bacterium]
MKEIMGAQEKQELSRLADKYEGLFDEIGLIELRSREEIERIARESISEQKIREAVKKNIHQATNWFERIVYGCDNLIESATEKKLEQQIFSQVDRLSYEERCRVRDKNTRTCKEAVSRLSELEVSEQMGELQRLSGDNYNWDPLTHGVYLDALKKASVS